MSRCSNSFAHIMCCVRRDRYRTITPLLLFGVLPEPVHATRSDAETSTIMHLARVPGKELPQEVPFNPVPVCPPPALADLHDAHSHPGFTRRQHSAHVKNPPRSAGRLRISNNTSATSKFRAESFISRLQAELDQPADVSATQGAPKRKAAGRDRRLEAFHCHKPWVTVSPSVRKLSSNSGASRERSPYTRGRYRQPQPLGLDGPRPQGRREGCGNAYLTRRLSMASQASSASASVLKGEPPILMALVF